MIGASQCLSHNSKGLATYKSWWSSSLLNSVNVHLELGTLKSEDFSGSHKQCSWQTMPLSLQKKRGFDENGENDESAFYPVKEWLCSSDPVKAMKMTKMAGVTQAKAWFTKGIFLFPYS